MPKAGARALKGSGDRRPDRHICRNTTHQKHGKCDKNDKSFHFLSPLLQKIDIALIRHSSPPLADFHGPAVNVKADGYE